MLVAVERVVAVFWQWIWEPMLFVTIGSSIHFKTLDSGTIPRSVAIICTGLTLRALTTFLVMGRFGYTWREKLFYAVAWTPKATVQAALSGACSAAWHGPPAGGGRRPGHGPGHGPA